METKIVDQAYPLFEAVNLLHAFVNETPAEHLTSQETLALRPEQLRAMTDACCAGLDRTEPLLQYYFKDRPIEAGNGPYCIAFAMVYSFMLWEHPAFDAHLAALDAYWQTLQTQGYCIRSVSKMGLFMTQDASKKGVPLASQIYSLELSAAERLELIEVFTNYSAHLEKLRRLLEPVVGRMEQTLEALLPQRQALRDAWQTFFDCCPAEQYLLQRGRIDLTQETERVVVAFSFADSWFLGGDFRNRDFFLYVGSGQPRSTKVGGRGAGILNDGEVNAMKLIGDPTRLSLLRMLSRERSYCLALSQKLNLNPGTVSRLLTGLCDVGLLDAQTEGGRTYYRTNDALLEGLFRNVLRYVRQED